MEVSSVLSTSPLGTASSPLVAVALALLGLCRHAEPASQRQKQHSEPSSPPFLCSALPALLAPLVYRPPLALMPCCHQHPYYLSSPPLWEKDSSSLMDFWRSS